MKNNVTKFAVLSLLLCLLLAAIACGGQSHTPSENTQPPAASGTGTPETGEETAPGTQAGIPSDTTGDHTPNTDAATDLPLYPGDIDIDMPELQETVNIMLSLKDGKVLGASTLNKPISSDVIDSYNDFRTLYGAVEGINESFFETHVLKLVHTAQSSGSTRYAVESVTVAEGKIKVEIIEQHPPISTRDLRYWYVFAAVEKSQADLPVDTNVTGVQLAG